MEDAAPFLLPCRSASWSGPGMEQTAFRRWEDPDGRERAKVLHSVRSRNLERLAILEEALADCRGQLHDLEARAWSPPAQLPLAVEVDPADDHWARALAAKGRELWQRLEGLAADALEDGHARDLPGVMDIYQEANVEIDRVAGMLELCHEAEAAKAGAKQAASFETEFVAVAAAPASMRAAEVLDVESPHAVGSITGADNSDDILPRNRFDSWRLSNECSTRVDAECVTEISSSGSPSPRRWGAPELAGL